MNATFGLVNVSYTPSSLLFLGGFWNRQKIKLKSVLHSKTYRSLFWLVLWLYLCSGFDTAATLFYCTTISCFSTCVYLRQKAETEEVTFFVALAKIESAGVISI